MPLKYIKRHSLHFAVFLLTALLGMVPAYVRDPSKPLEEDPPKVISERPDRFEVYLNVIEVKDSDVQRWNINSGYLSLYDAEFLDENTILSLYLQDGMRISRDGGRTSQRLFVESGGLPEAAGGFTLHGLDFINSRTGWAFGSCLIKTVDGGQTWTKVELPDWMDNLRVKFLDQNVGYVAGRAGFRGNTSLKVYKTVDGGKTWKRSFGTREIDTPWDIFAVDEEIVMLTGGGGWMWRTGDGGKTWKAILNKDYHRVMAISRSPDGKFWLFGKNSIRISNDLGVTWQKAKSVPESIGNHEWGAVDFTKDGLGVAVSEDAAIIFTRDSGRSWRKVKSNLHFQEKIRVPNNPFDEALRSIRLSGNRGIINGSQRDYFITIADQ